MGSHKVVARVLSKTEPRGIKGGQLSRQVLAEIEEGHGEMKVEEVQADAGDVMLTHPFLLHARSKNLGKVGDENFVRFMCNPNVALKQDMNFPRKSKLFHKQMHDFPNGDMYTPVEQAIVDALMEEKR